MGKKLNSRQQCASDVAGDVAGDKSLAIGVHFRFGPCTIKSFTSTFKIIASDIASKKIFASDITTDTKRYHQQYC